MWAVCCSDGRPVGWWESSNAHLLLSTAPAGALASHAGRSSACCPPALPLLLTTCLARPAWPAGMKRAMLEVVVSGVVVEPSDVERYIRCTLLAAMNDYQVGVLARLASWPCVCCRTCNVRRLLAAAAQRSLTLHMAPSYHKQQKHTIPPPPSRRKWQTPRLRRCAGWARGTTHSSTGTTPRAPTSPRPLARRCWPAGCRRSSAWCSRCGGGRCRGGGWTEVGGRWRAWGAAVTAGSHTCKPGGAKCTCCKLLKPTVLPAWKAARRWAVPLHHSDKPLLPCMFLFLLGKPCAGRPGPRPAVVRHDY